MIAVPERMGGEPIDSLSRLTLGGIWAILALWLLEMTVMSLRMVGGLP